jgi:hypothetical protein
MSDQTNSHTRGCQIGCLIYCIGIPLLIVFVLIAVLLINNRPPHIKVVPQKLPKPNGWDYFVKAGKMLPTGSKVAYGPVSSSEPMNSWTMAEYEQFMKLNAPALAVVRDGLKKPYMCPRVNYFQDWPPYGYFREIARRLRSESMYYRKTGQYAKAADSLLDCQELGVQLPRGGNLIGGLVGVAIQRIGGEDQLGPLLPKLSKDELLHVAKRFERIQSKRVLFFDVLVEEADCCTLEYKYVYSSSDFRKTVVNPIYWTTSESLKKPRKLKMDLQHIFCNKQKMIAETAHYYKDVAREQRGYYTGKTTVQVPKNYITSSYPSGVNDLLVQCRFGFVRTETAATIMQTEVALRRYNFDHGSYPNSLRLLIPKYLKKIPVDPFGQGKPLHYNLLDGGKDFLLYSLGPNLRDDGGKPGKWDTRSTAEDLVAGKW